MRFYTASATDVGTKRQINQDCLVVRNYSLPLGNIALAVLCDGMGGLSHGEIASRSIVSAFVNWADECLPKLDGKEIYDGDIRRQWTEITSLQNDIIRAFGESNGFKIGSTVTVMLLTETRYYILNLGDSRAYKIDASGTVRITTDHTVAENEIELGNMTETQALSSPMRSVLTKCVGISEITEPDMFFGDTEPKTIYLLCSDGFRHLITAEEMKVELYNGAAIDPASMKDSIERLIEINKQRGETDNISAAVIYAE